MLVDVTRLRRAGEKIPDTEVRTAVPARGRLCSWSYSGYVAGKIARIQAVTLTKSGDASGEAMLPPLHHFRVTRIRGSALLLVGVEEIEIRRRHVEEYRQAWLCRLAFDEPQKQNAPQFAGHSVIIR